MVCGVLRAEQLNSVRCLPVSAKEVADQNAATDLNLIAIFQDPFASQRAIHERSVGTPLVDDAPAFFLTPSEKCMSPGTLCVMQLNVIDCAASERDLFMRKLIPLPLIGTLNHEQSELWHESELA